MADGAGSYTDQELEAILRRALERQASTGDEFGHDDLIAAAREVGLDEGAVEHAIAELSHERSLEEVRESIRRRRRERWRRHFIAFAAVVGGLLGMYGLGLAGPWVFWVAFGWGIGMALDTHAKLRQPTDDEVERERNRLNRRERRKRAAEARREAKRRYREERAARKSRKSRKRGRSETNEQVERVIEEGVNLLLGAAARKLREHAEREQRRDDTEFGRYVARKQGRRRADSTPPRAHTQGRRRADSTPPRVRIDADVRDEAPATFDEHELESTRRRSKRRR